jgi:hypothetical protein
MSFGKPASMRANLFAQGGALLLLASSVAIGACDDFPYPPYIPPASTGAGPTEKPFTAPDSPVQACVEYCEIANAQCGETTECEKECAAEIVDGTAFCEQKIGLKYACFIANTSPDKCQWWWGPCWSAQIDAAECLLEHGCWSSPHVCEPSDVFLDECHCKKSCKVDMLYEAHCTTDFGVIHCDCSIGGVLAGTCEQPEFICDVWTSCCRQFFEL